MKVLTSKKAIITILSLGSLVLAGTIKDINSRTVSRKQALAELLPIERALASNNEEGIPKIALTEVEMSEAYKINAEWEITRIVASDETVTFDKYNHPEDAKKMIKVPMKLIGKSLVMINNDPGLKYNISLLSDFGTIAIFKKIGNGIEILEAKMVKVAKKDEELAVSEEIELVLERALNQAKSPKILTGQDISGEMVLSKTSIEGLTVSITNGNGEIQNIEIPSAQLMDGGSFKADVDNEEISGVVFNNGKDGYRVSFVTGPMAGAMLNFVTREELTRVEEKDADLNDNYYQNDEAAPAVAEEKPEEQKEVRDERDMQPPVNAEMAEQEVIEERREVASDPENAEPVSILSAEEVKETAQTQGYNF